MILKNALFALTLFSALSLSVPAQQIAAENLARAARATASSEAEGTGAANLIDGDTGNTHWRAKDGTSPAETWVELSWPKVLQFQEIVIRQGGSPELSHVNLETRDGSGNWRLLRSIGDSNTLLPRTILAQFRVQESNGLRLSAFSGTVDLAQVEVYNRIDSPVVVLGSDLLNHIFGMVTDAFGAQPFVNVPVQVRGTAGGKPWEESAKTDATGVFQVDMPVGLEGSLVSE